jgi:hypothetical protein
MPAPDARSRFIDLLRASVTDGTLVKLPDDVDHSDDRLATALATLTDVCGTGHHAGHHAAAHQHRIGFAFRFHGVQRPLCRGALVCSRDSRPHR